MSSRRTRKRLAQSLFDSLEERRLLAAHVVGGGSYSTIQAAVDAAPVGATINVDAGLYTGGVQVWKSLTLRGARAGVDGRSNIRTDMAGETIVTGFLFVASNTRSSSFSVETNNIVLDGFTCQDASNLTYYGGAGISIFPNVFGTQVRNCVVQNNVLGLHLSNNSPTVPAIIEKNHFTDNNIEGPNYGRAIYTDGGISGGTLQNVIIDNNQFSLNLGDGNIQPAIGLEASTLASIQTNITISNNYFDVNGKAVLAFNASNLNITGNTIAWNRDTKSGGLRFEGGVSNVNITGNTIHNSEARGIRLDRKAFAANNSGFVITGNNIFGNGDSPDVDHDGIYIGDIDNPTADTYTGTLTATNNWWGHSSGPGGDGPGSGDKIFANGETVTFSPWATTPFLPLQKPYSGAASNVGYTIQAENFDHGNQGLAYSDINDNLNYFYRPYESPDLELTTDADGVGNVFDMRTNEYLAYTVNVPQAGTYTASLRVSTTQTTGATLKFQLPDGLGGWTDIGPAHVVTNTTGAWQTQTRSDLVFPTSGLKTLRLLVSSGGSSSTGTKLNWFKFTFNTTGPVAPTNLTAVASGANINLSWTDTNSNETGTVIEKKIGAGAYSVLASVGPNITTYSDTSGFSVSTTYTYRVRAVTPGGDSPNSNEAVATPVTYLSDLTWTSMTNGWGPVELDRAVGTSSPGDGPIITLNGVPYAKGLGAHAVSEIVYNLGGAYTTLVSDIGIDDATGGGTGGQVQFQVFLDANPVAAFDSGLMTGSSATQTASVNVTGVTTLRLKVLDGGNGLSNDWGDWAGARLLTGTTVTPTLFNGTATGDTYLLRMNSTNLQVFIGGGLLWSSAKANFPLIKFNPGVGEDTLNVDYQSGNPIPTGGVFFDGSTGVADTLIITGTASADTVTVANALSGPTAGNIAINDATTGAATVEGITFNGGVGNDTLTIASAPAAPITYNGGLTVTDQDTLNLNAGAYTFATNANTTTANLTLNVNNAGTAVTFTAAQWLAGLSISNAAVTLAADGARFINTGTLAVTGTGKLDLKDNDMIVRTGTLGGWNAGTSSYTDITGLIDAGNNNGTWTGNGIVTSQSAALGSRGRTTLAIATGTNLLGIAAGATGVWQTQTVTGSAILIKYTYAGDTDLDGSMGGDDYFRLDNGFSAQATGYFAGDNDYNGLINIDDYFWMDEGYHFHGGTL